MHVLLAMSFGFLPAQGIRCLPQGILGDRSVQAGPAAMATMRWQLSFTSDDGVVWRGEHESVDDGIVWWGEHETVDGQTFLPLRRNRKMARWCGLSNADLSKSSWLEDMRLLRAASVKAVLDKAMAEQGVASAEDVDMAKVPQVVSLELPAVGGAPARHMKVKFECNARRKLSIEATPENMVYVAHAIKATIADSDAEKCEDQDTPDLDLPSGVSMERKRQRLVMRWTDDDGRPRCKTKQVQLTFDSIREALQEFRDCTSRSCLDDGRASLPSEA